jgi:SpoVK/Ycf46/Vps4 family AAA+-type ATPase
MRNLKDILEEAEMKQSDKILIKNVTHSKDAIGKELNKPGDGSWYDIKGDYILELKDLNYQERKTVPGMYKLVPNQYGIKKVKQTLLKDENFEKLQTVNLKSRMESFFSKVDLLRQYGLTLVKRGILLHGAHGGGKTHQINTAVSEVLGDKGVSFSFSTSVTGIDQFVDYLADNPPTEEIDKLIVIIEDLGGGEMPDLGHRVMSSQDELLSFLDGNNIPDTWRGLPIVIFSTTNYPMLFLANLIDRPGRFDEVIEVPYPDPALLVEYAEKFMNEPLTDFDKREIMKGSISIAHIKDACIKKLVYQEPIHDTVKKMREWSERVKKSMEEKGG